MAALLGATLRGVAKAFDGVGIALQSPYGVKETLNKAQTLLPFLGKSPSLGAGAFVAPSASVVGDVSIGQGASVWYGAVIRGDVGRVTIGPGASVQENAVVHVARHNPAGLELGASIGEGAVIAQGATVHAAEIGAGAVVGIGATVLDGAKLAPGSLLAAGSVLTPGSVVGEGQVFAGSPAKFLRDLAEAEKAFLADASVPIAELAALHAAENAKGFNEVELDLARRADRRERDPDYDHQQGIERDQVTREIVANANA